MDDTRELTMQDAMGRGATPEPVNVTPPPPPRFDPRPTLWQQRLLLLLAGVGLALAAAGHAFELEVSKLLQRGGLFLVCYAAVVATSWLPPSVLSRRIDAFLERWVKNGASGFYGMMALATYAHLELGSLAKSIAGLELSLDWVTDVAIQAAIGFSIDSVMNFVWAMAWPATLWGRGNMGGIAPTVLIAVSWGVFELGRRYLPHTALGKDSC